MTNSSTPSRFPPWQRLGEFDGFVIDGVDYRRLSSDERGQVLYETSRPSVTASHSHQRWEQIRNAPGFQHFRGLHDPHRPSIQKIAGVEFPSDIPDRQFMWMQFVESMILSLEVQVREKKLKLVASEVQEAIDGEMGRQARRKLKERQLGSSSAGAQAYIAFDISGPALIKKRREYLKKGLLVLRDGRYRSGRGSHLHPDVAAMLALAISEANASTNPTSILDDLRDDIEVLNEEASRKALNSGDEDAISKLVLLKPPNIKTVRQAWKDRDRFSGDIAEFGIDAAVRLNPAIRGAPDKLGPLDRVEYDESIVDAITILVESGVWSFLTNKEKKEIKKGRMVIGVAICTVTRCIVAMRIYAVGNGQETVETFKMIFEDKTRYIPVQLRDRISWPQHGGVGTVVMDQGSNNIDQDARVVLANLGVPIVYARAGNPGERGVGERIFRTFGHRIYSLLDARTGSNVLDRKSYRPEDRASLTIDELWQFLAVGVAGIYHNSPHRELDGRTPAGEWERLVPHYGVDPLPDPNRRRVTFGKRRLRKVTPYGIAFFGLSYVHPLIDHHYLHGTGKLEVAGDPDDLGAVSFRYGEQWHEALCVDPEMRGVRWLDWFAACKVQKDLAADDAAKRRPARRAAKKNLRAIQDGARNRADAHPDVISVEMIDKAERAIFGKYQHAAEDQPVHDGKLGIEVVPDNSDAVLPAGPMPVAEVPSSPKPSGRRRKTWSIEP